MSHPDEIRNLTRLVFGDSACRVIDTTPAHELARLEQGMTQARIRRANYLASRTPEQVAEDEAFDAEADAAMDAMTPADWAALGADLARIERRILIDRGVDPDA
jgi:hypothetical protein